MVLASKENPGGSPPMSAVASAGAADIFHVLTLLSGRLATGERPRDVTVTSPLPCPPPPAKRARTARGRCLHAAREARSRRGPTKAS
jgi:hypothetical protein